MRLWIVLVLLGPLFAYAEGNVELRWETPKPVVGEPVELIVSGQGLEDVFGMQMDLEIEGDMISGDKPVRPGPIWPEQNRMELRNTKDGGTTRWAFSLLRPADPISGGGVLARIPLESDQAGEVSVSVSELKFGTEEGDVLTPEVVLSEQPLTIYASQEEIPAKTLPAKWVAGSTGVAVAFLAAAAWLWRKRKIGP